MENYTMHILNVPGKENQVVEGIERIEADAINAALMKNHDVDVQKMVDKFKRGKKIMYPFRYERWAKQVGAYEAGDRNGIETTIALNIMEKIDSKEVPLEKLVEDFRREDYCSDVRDTVRYMVMKLSKNGFPFFAATHERDWTVEECNWIYDLLKENYEYDSKSDIAKEVAKSMSKLKEIKKSIIRKRQIEEGKKLIYPFRYDEWKMSVEDGLTRPEPDCGVVTDRALEILQAIEDKKPLEEIVQIFEAQNNTESKKNNIRWRVLVFSKNGFPFYEATHDAYWTLDECLFIKDKFFENEKYGKDSESIDLSESKKKVYSKIKRLQKLEDKSIN